MAYVACQQSNLSFNGKGGVPVPTITQTYGSSESQMMTELLSAVTLPSFATVQAVAVARRGAHRRSGLGGSVPSVMAGRGRLPVPSIFLLPI